jgi:hypothetical protein
MFTSRKLLANERFAARNGDCPGTRLAKHRRTAPQRRRHQRDSPRIWARLPAFNLTQLFDV